jgi:hypothetical protein
MKDSEDDAALLVRELRRRGYDPLFGRVPRTDAAWTGTWSRSWRRNRDFLDERQSSRKNSSLADVEVNVSAVPYDRGRVLCLVAHDVTERKRVERALEEIGGAQPDSPRTPRRHPAEHRL